jgi:molybdopterin/thiamine biosynthesis adenylyltransferase
MSSASALDRTIALLGGDLFPNFDRDLLAAELTSTTVIIGADRANLTSPAAQTALVTAFLAIAQCGFRIHLDIPDVEICGPQPPLRGARLPQALVDLAADLITPASLGPAPVNTPQVLLGDSPAREGGEVLRIGGGPWRAEVRLGSGARLPRFKGELPIGPVLAGIAASAEVVRNAATAIRDRKELTVAAEFDLGAAREVTLELVPLPLRAELDLGAVDFISAGAITNGCIYVLLRMLGLTGRLRLIDADHGELTNLNRYPLLRRSNLGMAKVEILAGYSSERLNIEPLELRFDQASIDRVGPLAAKVVCGVDDIPSRWLVQEMGPRWLCVGGTAHFMTLISEHVAGMPCAGCMHPEDDPGAPAELPTISFASLLAGALQAYRLLANASSVSPSAPVLGASFNLSARFALDEIGLAARADCPVGCQESATV